MKTAMSLFHLLAISLALAGSARAQLHADTVLLNGKIVTLDTAAPAAEALAVRDGKIMVVGKSDDVRKLAGAGTRTIDLGGPHRHSGPDRFPHARDPCRHVLCHRGELDRRQIDSRRDGAHQGNRAARQTRPMDHRGGRLDAAAVRREAPPDPGRADRRSARQPGLHPVVLQRGAAHARRLQGAQHHQGRGRAAERQDRARRQWQSVWLDRRRQSDDLRPVRQAAAADIRRERRGHASSSSANSTAWG